MSKSDDGLSKVYSPVNQAWLVMWHETVLRVFNDEADADAYIDYLRSGRDYGSGAIWQWPKPGEGGTNGLDGAYEDYGARYGEPALTTDQRLRLREEYYEGGGRPMPQWLTAWNAWYDASYALCHFLAGGWRGPCFPDLLVYALADEGVSPPSLPGSADPEGVRAALLSTAPGQLMLPGIQDALDYLVDFVAVKGEDEYLALAEAYLNAQDEFAEVHEEIRERFEFLESFPPELRDQWDPIYEIHLMALM